MEFLNARPGVPNSVWLNSYHRSVCAGQSLRSEHRGWGCEAASIVSPSALKETVSYSCTKRAACLGGVLH